jgi:hypothetical protein
VGCCVRWALLVRVVFAGCRLSRSYLCQGVTLVVFAWCHRGVLRSLGVIVACCVHQVSFIGELPLSGSCIHIVLSWGVVFSGCCVRWVLCSLGVVFTGCCVRWVSSWHVVFTECHLSGSYL